MRCVHCGKPLGRFRKATGEFCSEEHRNEYRDQIERAALERLLISRKKLTSNQKHSVVPEIIAELVHSPFLPLNAAGPSMEIWPLPATEASLFPSSAGYLEGRGLPAALVLPLSYRLPRPANRQSGPAEAGPIPASTVKLHLPVNGLRRDSLGLRSALDPLPIPGGLPDPTGGQPVTYDLKAEPIPPSNRRIAIRDRPAGPARPDARTTRTSLAQLALLPIPPAFTSRLEVHLPGRSPEPLLGSARLNVRAARLDPCKLIGLAMALRSDNGTIAPVEAIPQPFDSPRPCRLQFRVRAACRLPVAPMASISFAAILPAGQPRTYASELPVEPATMLLLPGTRTSGPADPESGVPDRLDELQLLAMPEPLRPSVTGAPEPPAIVEFRPLPLFPGSSWQKPEIALADATVRECKKFDIEPLPNGRGSVARVAFTTVTEPRPVRERFRTVMPRGRVQAFDGMPPVATRLVRLSPPTLADCPGVVKKTSGPTDGEYNEFAASADGVYPPLGLQLQAGWNAGRSRLVRIRAAVPARDCAVGVRGTAEPADAGDWQAPLKPRLRLVPVVWQVDGPESIKARSAAIPARKLAGIGVKGGVIVFSLVLAFGLYSAISNPQPVSATARDTESATMAGPLRVLQERVVRRAGIHLADDFRTGLHAWEGGEDWSDSWSYDEAGFVHPGRLALYTPSLKMSDYRLEFVGQIHRKSLAWVVRAADVKNYVAVKLVHTRSGPISRLAIVRYSVIDGKEERHKQIAFPFEARVDTVYHIRMEVRGNRYSLFVQDRIADAWEDDRLSSGGVGFFSAKGEDARLRWVRLTYQYDWVGRICAALAG